ncbi:MAG: hypothetical protein KDK54_22805 [Leptospiraceae bacterium]|nr:hypothetical protein [Leptospiraceae bacterium]MCB1557619.1 hypothetical protein [Alphaproteobacteria bacterium]
MAKRLSTEFQSANTTAAEAGSVYQPEALNAMAYMISITIGKPEEMRHLIDQQKDLFDALALKVVNRLICEGRLTTNQKESAMAEFKEALCGEPSFTTAMTVASATRELKAWSQIRSNENQRRSGGLIAS